MRHLALARLRRTPGRYLACALAVTIAVAFAVLVQLVGTAVAQVVRDGDVASTGGADVAVRAAWQQAEVDPADPDALAAAVAADEARVAEVAALDGVAAVHRSGVAFADADLPRAVGEQTVNVAVAPPEGDLRWAGLREGRWPTAPGETAVGGDAQVGDEVELRPFTPEDSEPVTVPLTVVGVVDVGLATEFPFDAVLLVPEQAVPLGAGNLELLVDAEPGADPATLLRSVQAAVGPGSTDPLGDVVPADDVRAERARASETLVLVLRTGIGAFAALAVAVAVVVVANTFSVLLAQRVREQALLRCIGATRRDLWRAGTTEAALLGLAAGAAGLLLGWALAALATLAVTRWLPVAVDVPSPSPLEAVAALALGAVATSVASVSAMLRAGRVSPLAALRPVEAVPEAAHASRLRVVLGGLLVLVGGTGTVLGAVGGQVLLALPAGLLAFVGVLVLGRVLLPAVAAALGRAVSAAGGPAGTLAAASVGRNPRRTAATAGAVVIGVTLAVTAAVGASSLRATATAELASFTPVDSTVGAPSLDAAGTAALASSLRGSDGVAAAQPAVQVDVSLSPGRAAGEELTWSTTALAGDLRPVLPSADVPPDSGSVVLSADLAGLLEVGTGDVITVAGDQNAAGPDDGTAPPPVPARSLVVVVDADSTADVQLDPATATGLGGSSAVIVSLAEGLSRDEVQVAVDLLGAAALEADPAAEVDSPVLQLGALQQTFDVLLAVVGGMLAVTVAIALVGVTNTLSLSLTERRQENALLRALGLSRARLRAMVAWEALVLGLVGATVGVVLGTGFGIAGTYSVIGSSGTTVVDVPWLVLGGLAFVVSSVAVGASLWPANRASKFAPASALGAAA
ncbi:FtsX-like permease family protein [Aquipuribacter sp. MA13-6]|uniref:FtsX-like permease family protein n=1 Tax=unclassified Aquipuribacter TaxID=2635084 RepID=UPI003EE86790